jgi:hypothetical protein
MYKYSARNINLTKKEVVHIYKDICILLVIQNVYYENRFLRRTLQMQIT